MSEDEMTDSDKTMSAEDIQILADTIASRLEPHFLTKADLAELAAKGDFSDIATKADLAELATKEDFSDIATKADLEGLKEGILRLGEKFGLPRQTLLEATGPRNASPVQPTL